MGRATNRVINNSERLAKLIDDRLDDMGLRKQDVPRLGGPSARTFRKVMLGEKVSDESLKGVEKVLGWPRGYCAQILSGGPEEDIPLETVTGPRPDEVVLILPPASLTGKTAEERARVAQRALGAALEELARMDEQASQPKAQHGRSGPMRA